MSTGPSAKDGLLILNMTNNKNKKSNGFERHLITVSVSGFVGLIVSLYLLMDYKEPLLNVWKLILASIFG